MMVALLMAVDFMNFDYPDSCDKVDVPTPIQIRKGVYEYTNEQEGNGYTVRVDTVKRGSLSTGTQQAVVVLSWDYPIGGSGVAFAYDERGKIAVLLGCVGQSQWGGDWGRYLINTRFRKNFLYVETCKDDACALSEVRTYALRGGKLVKVYTLTHKAPAVR